MYLDINKYLLVVIGWLIRTSYQLDCVQCTSPIRRVSQSWDHSCLDGTLSPLPCEEDESIASYKQCVSALYSLSQRGSAGVLIYRGCTTTQVVQHGCDPPEPSIDFDKTSNFYCSRSCSYNGCNYHSVEEISSNANKLLKNEFILLYFICMIFLFFFWMQFIFLIELN